ncbi:ATP synthase, partial [Zea mays]
MIPYPPLALWQLAITPLLRRAAFCYPRRRLNFPAAVPSDHQLLLVLLSQAHQPRRAPGVPGGQGERAPHAGVGAVPRALSEVAGSDAAPGQQLRRRGARRDQDHRVRPGPGPGPSRCPGACPVQAAHARLPAVAHGQELQHEPRRRGVRRGQRPAAAADGGAPRGGGLRRGAGRAPDRAHRAQDAPPHRVRQPQGRQRRGRVPPRRLRRPLRHRRLARHRPQRQGPARRAPEPRRLHRPPDRPRPRTPAPLIIRSNTSGLWCTAKRAIAKPCYSLQYTRAYLHDCDYETIYRTELNAMATTVFLSNVVVNRDCYLSFLLSLYMFLLLKKRTLLYNMIDVE